MDDNDEPVHRYDDQVDPEPDRNAPTEATPLESFDVFSFIVNKMIGTGIFTAPSTVLLYTRNKQLALATWALGFIYTIFSMFIYLDYAAVFPYTGGEIVYIDEITSANTSYTPTLLQPAARQGEGPAAREHPQVRESEFRRSLRRFLWRFLGDGLLAYVVYAFLFCGLFTSGTNVMQVGRQLLISIHPDEDPNRDLIRFIGVVTVSLICLIQLFSARAGRVLNNLFAVIKILFLVILLCFGFAKLAHNQSNNVDVGDFTESHSSIDGSNKLNFAPALLVVLYSYEGWENANFVAGEISTENPATLRTGFIWAVLVVGTLYMSLNAVFVGLMSNVLFNLLIREQLSAISYVEVENQSKQFNYASMLSSMDGPSTTSIRAWAAIIAISSAGNVNTVVYTFTRVKQSIGQANILPWSFLWKMDFNPSLAVGIKRNGDRHKTPLGGLLLEWLGSVILISISAIVPGIAESVSLPGNVQTYAHCFVLVILGAGLFRLKGREQDLGVIVSSSWFPRISHFHWIGLFVFVILYSAMNVFILVESGREDTPFTDNLPPATIFNTTAQNATIAASSHTFEGVWYPTVLLSVIGLSLGYYYLVFAAYIPQDPFYNWTILRFAKAECNIRKKPTFDMALEEVRRFGHRRTIGMSMSDPHSKFNSFLYWLFGGQVRPDPLKALTYWLKRVRNKVKITFVAMGSCFVSGKGTERSSVGNEDGYEMDDMHTAGRATSI